MQTCKKTLEISYLEICAKQWDSEYLLKYLFLLLFSLHDQWETVR